jgi:hypothetical protein
MAFGDRRLVAAVASIFRRLALRYVGVINTRAIHTPLGEGFSPFCAALVLTYINIDRCFALRCLNEPQVSFTCPLHGSEVGDDANPRLSRHTYAEPAGPELALACPSVKRA